MTIKRLIPVIVNEKIEVEETEITLSFEELREAYKEFLLESKIEDIALELKNMEEDSEGQFDASLISDKDRELMARDLIDEIDCDSNYWDKVRESIERYL